MSNSWCQHLLVHTVGNADGLAKVRLHALRGSGPLITVKLAQNMRPLADRSTTFIRCSRLNVGPSCVRRAHRGLRHREQLNNELSVPTQWHMPESNEDDQNVLSMMSGCVGNYDQMAQLGLRMHTAICRLPDWLRERWIFRTQRWWVRRLDTEEWVAWSAC